MHAIRSLCVSALLILTGSAVAGGGPVFRVDSGVGLEGDQFTLSISYSAGGNADSLEGELLYDSANLTAEVVGPGGPAMPLCGGLANAISPDIVMTCADDGMGTITFSGFSPTNSTAVSGSFGAIRFTVANPINPAPPQVFPLDITNELFEDDGVNVPAGVSTDGSITVGGGAGPGVMDVSPTFVNMVSTVNNPATTAPITISNAGAPGDATLTANCSLMGVVADPGITLTVQPFNGMLAPDASQAVTASCSGTTAGIASGSYDCDGGPAGSDSSTVSCAVGTGVAIPNPPAGSLVTMLIGPLVRGQSGNATQSFSESNNAGTGYDVNCVVSDDGGGTYALSSPALQSVPPGGGVDFNVTAQSSIIDPQPTGTMVCTYSNGAIGDVTVTLDILVIEPIPKAVPTLSQWGLILMIVAFAGFGARRRKNIA